MKGNETPFAKAYLNLYGNVKHKGYINLYDAESACKIAFAEAVAQFSDASNIHTEDTDRIKKHLEEFKRIFKLNQ